MQSSLWRGCQPLLRTRRPAGRLLHDKAGSRLEWDPEAGQWTRRANRRSPSRQELLRQIKEAKKALPDGISDKVKQEALESVAGLSNKKKDVLEPNEQRYYRGQASDTLRVRVGNMVHGVAIPVRPSPPESDMCCMTGCPRCVYDIYTEDLQLHFEAMDKARRELKTKGVPPHEWPSELKMAAPASMQDEDGVDTSAFDRASETVTSEIKDLDISLRSFLKFERELRQRRKAEQARAMALEHTSQISEAPRSPLRATNG